MRGLVTNPHALEALYHRLGCPAWFWPAVLSLIFVVLPLIGGALEATV